MGLLTVRVRGQEVRGDQPLERRVEYVVVPFPIFRDLARLTDDDDGDDNHDNDGDAVIDVNALPKLLAELCQGIRPGVHLWRLSPPCSKRQWVDLIVEGPSSSAYDGTTFTNLHVAVLV
jgi:hypothetical protein